MNIMIINKWLTNYTEREQEAPSIITMFVDIFLDKGKVTVG